MAQKLAEAMGEPPEGERMGQTPPQRDPRLIRPWIREGMSFESWKQSKLASGELVQRIGEDGKTIYSLMPKDGNPTARGNIIRIDYSKDGHTFTRYMYEDTNGDGRLNKDVLIIERFNTTKVAGESLLVQTARIDNSDRFDSNTFSVSDDGSSISFTAKKGRSHFRFDTVDDNRRPTQATYAIAFYEPRADGEETKVTKPGDLTPLAYIEVYDQDTDQLLGQWHVNAQTGEMTWSTKNAPALKEHENRTIQRIQADDLTDAWKQGNKGFHLRAKYDSKGRFITTDEPWRRGLE
ncbi:hypothetical protein [Leptonema illini]|nr:hypothetical protein [Leptonema illini]